MQCIEQAEVGRRARPFGKSLNLTSCFLADHGGRHIERGLCGNGCAGDGNVGHTSLRPDYCAVEYHSAGECHRHGHDVNGR